jgi:glutaredoxin
MVFCFSAATAPYAVICGNQTDPLPWHHILECTEKPAKLAFSMAESPQTQPREVVLYSRKGCHLCEIVKESLVKLQKRGDFTWREIDVDSDAEVRRLYTDEVPVVFVDGQKAFKYRMDEREFLRKLSA